MTTELIAFDYSGMDKDAKGKLISLAGEIRRQKEKHATSGFEIGRSVAASHAVFAGNGGEGQFSSWVERECGFSKRTAYNYMNAWREFGNCATVAQFDVSAIYALSSETQGADKARKEAIKLADKGQKITHEKAKEILNRFREVSARKKKSSGSASAASSASPAAASQETGAAEEDCNEHVRDQINAEAATGDMHAKPDWKGLLGMVGELRRAAGTIHSLCGKRWQHHDQWQTTCGILDNIAGDWQTDWRKVK